MIRTQLPKRGYPLVAPSVHRPNDISASELPDLNKPDQHKIEGSSDVKSGLKLRKMYLSQPIS